MLNPNENQQEVVATLDEEALNQDKHGFEIALSVIAHNVGCDKENIQNHDLYEDLWEDDTLADSITEWYLKWKEEGEDIPNAHAFAGHVLVNIQHRAKHYSSDLQTAADYLVGDDVNPKWGEWCFTLSRLSRRE